MYQIRKNGQFFTGRTYGGGHPVFSANKDHAKTFTVKAEAFQAHDALAVLAGEAHLDLVLVG